MRSNRTRLAKIGLQSLRSGEAGRRSQTVAVANRGNPIPDHVPVRPFQIGRRLIALLVSPQKMREILFHEGQEDAPRRWLQEEQTAAEVGSSVIARGFREAIKLLLLVRDERHDGVREDTDGYACIRECPHGLEAQVRRGARGSSWRASEVSSVVMMIFAIELVRRADL